MRPRYLVLLKIVCWLSAVVLGGWAAWVRRFTMNADGVSYLDIADAYLRGDYHAALNAYWSPLYSWLLGGALSLLKPSSYWEYPVTHLVNFAVYLGALVSFNFFLKQLILHSAAQTFDHTTERSPSPEWAWVVLGHILFIWSSLVLIGLETVTPDMCVATLTYWAAGILLRIRMGNHAPRTFALLGVILGLSYLAKAPMFLLSIVILPIGALLAGPIHRTWRLGLISLSCFLLIAAPFIFALSISKGRLTFGDSGKLNYCWSHGIPPKHWQGHGVGGDQPLHPTRKLFERPAVYEFATPIHATYPVWYDPSYWYEGIAIHFDLEKQLRTAAYSIHLNLRLFSSRFLLTVSVLSFIILFGLTAKKTKFLQAHLAYWYLFIPALAGLGMYSAVYSEGRHIAPFLVLFFCGMGAGISTLNLSGGKLVRLMTGAAFVLLLSTSIVRHTSEKLLRDLNAPHTYWQIAEGLRKRGVGPGDKVASLGSSNYFHVKWARLARVHIIAEVYDDLEADYFWVADERVQQQVLDVVAKTGACVIVSDWLPESASASEWQRIGNTEAYVHFLPKQ